MSSHITVPKAHTSDCNVAWPPFRISGDSHLHACVADAVREQARRQLARWRGAVSRQTQAAGHDSVSSQSPPPTGSATAQPPYLGLVMQMVLIITSLSMALLRLKSAICRGVAVGSGLGWFRRRKEGQGLQETPPQSERQDACETLWLLRPM